MKLVEMKCKNCGAQLKVDLDRKQSFCQFCGTKFQIDDEIQHHKIDDAEQTGYEFEKGRIRAQQENNNSKSQVIYVNNNSNSSKNHGCLFYMFWIFLFPIALTYFVAKSNKLNKGAKIAIIATLWGIIIIWGAVENIEEEKLKQDPWTKECTEISDFKYILDNDNIIISSYNGTDKRVKICETYKIDDKEYKVTKFSEGIFALKSVYSVILPEGLNTIPDNTFNSSDVKFIYIPSTLQPSNSGYSFYKYLHDVEAIYYGGSEEQWHVLTNNEARENIDTKKIEYNYKIEDLK